VPAKVHPEPHASDDPDRADCSAAAEAFEKQLSFFKE
jgi:hypothetical protein